MNSEPPKEKRKKNSKQWKWDIAELHCKLYDRFPDIKVSLATQNKTWDGCQPHFNLLGMPISQRGWNGAVNALLTMKGLQMWFGLMNVLYNLTLTEKWSLEAKGMPKPLKVWPKHPQKIYIWGGISMERTNTFDYVWWYHKYTMLCSDFRKWFVVIHQKEFSNGSSFRIRRWSKTFYPVVFQSSQCQLVENFTRNP